MNTTDASVPQPPFAEQGSDAPDTDTLVPPASQVDDTASADERFDDRTLRDASPAAGPDHTQSGPDASAQDSDTVVSGPGPRTPASPSSALPTVPEAPRTRWGGIIWGFVFLVLAGIGYWSTTALSAEFLADIWLRITPLAVGAGMVLIVGAIAVLCALVALARHLQRRSAAQRSRV